jgi:hypothetical protein
MALSNVVERKLRGGLNPTSDIAHVTTVRKIENGHAEAV